MRRTTNIKLDWDDPFFAFLDRGMMVLVQVRSDTMRHLTRLGPALVLFTFLLLPSLTRASDIVITSGALSVTGITGGPVFSMAGQDLAVAGVGGMGRVEAARLCHPCFAGDRIWLLSRFEDDLGAGPAVIDNIDYARLIYRGSMVFGTNTFVTLPFDDLPLLTLTASFTFGGTMLGFTPTSELIFSRGISGQGIAILKIDRDISTGGYNFRSITYEVGTPIPEPTTLLLLGTSLIGITAIIRRQRKANKSG